jgi:small neutral amino acid transporter SnatA (MarC family)
MIHGYEDLIVGSVAVALGLLLFATALLNGSWLYALHTSRWLESCLTRTGTRVLHALLGLALVALGVAVAQGFRWQLWN